MSGSYIGSIVAFCGERSAVNEEKLKKDGWLFCDGSPISRTEYKDLFAVIGDFNGSGDGVNTFNLPDYRGRFVRGVDEGVRRDPDAQSRTPATVGGNAGPAVGSVQGEGMLSHFHTLTVVSSDFTSGSRATSATINNNAVVLNALNNSDAGLQTCPKNVYVYFLIQARAENVTLPAGIVIGFNGERAANEGVLKGQGWLFCDGSPISRKDYKDLFAVTGNSNGSGDGVNTFNLPDYRGRFVRGVDEGTGRDPGAQFRTPATAGGNAGSAVGSVQPDQLRAHYHHILAATDDTGNSSVTGVVGIEASDHIIEMDVDAYGKSSETRPINAYIHWLINTREKSEPPVGCILAFSGLRNNNEVITRGWRFCDGSSISRTEYKDLFAVIGDVNGSGDGVATFNLPDYRGRFVRGVDEGTGRDPDASSRLPAQPGGRPGSQVGSVQLSALAVHSHLLAVYPGIGITPNSTAASGADPYTTTGIQTENSGDQQETRPINVYVYWLIRAR